MGPGVVLLLLLAAPIGALVNLASSRVGPQSPTVERLAKRLVHEPAHAYGAAALVAAGLALAVAGLVAVAVLLQLDMFSADGQGWTEWRYDALLRLLHALVGVVLLVAGWFAMTLRRALVRAEELRFGARFVEQ